MRGKRRVDKIPEEFSSYEEAANFWEAHDSAEYKNELEEVDIKVDLVKRHYLIELDKDTAEVLKHRATEKGISENHLAATLLKKELVSK